MLGSEARVRHCWHAPASAALLLLAITRAHASDAALFRSTRPWASWRRGAEGALAEGWGLVGDGGAAVGGGAAAADPVALVRDRYRASLLLTASGAASARKTVAPWLSTLNASCLWPDVAYSNEGRAVWLASDHMSRVLLMAQLWATEAGGGGGDSERGKSGEVESTAGAAPLAFSQDALLNATTCALGAWVQHDFQNPNWWWNDIGIPMDFGEVFLLLGQRVVPPATAAGANKIFARSDPAKPMTGANLVWETTNTLMHALFEGNATLVARCFGRIFASSVVEPQPEEGIMADGSFHQHGPELLAGSYGAAFTSTCLKLMAFASGTPFYMTPAQCDAFSTLVLDGQAWMVAPAAGGVLDWSVTGREISRKPGVSGCGFGPALLRNVSCGRAAEWAALAARLGGDAGASALVGHRHFYESDYAVLRGSAGNWSLSVRSWSKRTVNARCINSEGIRDERTADGVLNLYYDGSEYRNVPPAWNYLQLPGTVIRQSGPQPSCETTNQASPFEFVGGVSAGTAGAGAATQRLEGRGLSQLRSWFFFDHAVVALSANRTLTPTAAEIATARGGSNIGTSNAPSDSGNMKNSAPVMMTMASQALQGDVTVKLAGAQAPSALPRGNRTFPPGQVEWVHHRETLFACHPSPCAGAVTVVNDVVAGDWSTLGADSGAVETPLFHAAVDLGPASTTPPASADGGVVGYLVVPNTPVARAGGVGTAGLEVAADGRSLTTGVAFNRSGISSSGLSNIGGSDAMMASPLRRGASGGRTAADVELAVGAVFPSDSGGVVSFGSGLSVGADAASTVEVVEFSDDSVEVLAASPVATRVTVVVSLALTCPGHHASRHGAAAAGANEGPNGSSKGVVGGGKTTVVLTLPASGSTASVMCHRA